MADFSRTFDDYRSLEPSGWVSVFTRLPWWAGVLAVLLGLALLFYGGGQRAFRIVAVPLGAAMGWLLTPWVAIRMGYPAKAQAVQVICAVAFSALGAWSPVAITFLAVGMPAGFLAGEFVGPQDWVLGFMPAFLLTGTLGAMGHRFLSAVTSAVVGAWCVVIGTLSALRAAGVMADALSGHPWGVIFTASLFAVAGAVYQVGVRPSPQEVEERRFEEAQAKRREQERLALEKRWASYSNRKGS
ncbi:MAG: hypothetical protein K1X64_13770 [Myxococcaceae bacterium]|nr:hypothetical protein [Myxococcaceae bacterium]